MAGTDYGTDVYAVDDLPDPDVLASGPLNRAAAMARRLLEPQGVNEEIGDDAPYYCLDVRDWLGARVSQEDIRNHEAEVLQVLSQDETVITVEAELVFVGRVITLAVRGEGDDAPFSFVLKVDDVSATLLRGG